MTKYAPTPATYADLEKVPSNMVAEIIHGVLETHPRPLPRHRIVANALGFEVTGPFQKGRGGPGGWIFIPEPQLHLGPHVLVPDLAGWRRDRLPSLPTRVGITISPDWVCEILSPSTARLDRELKMPIYAEQGVGHVWLIEPEQRFIDAYCNVAGKWMLVGTATGDSDVSSPPFDAITFPMSDLFPFDPSSADEPTQG
jgi:Uma2 family endonuclease